MSSFAYLTHEGTTYLVLHDQDLPAHAPFSAVTDLIQIMWQTHGKDALRMVREPIFHLGELNEMEQGMITVAAKRSRRLTGTTEALMAGLKQNKLVDLTGQNKLLPLSFESPKQKHNPESAMKIAEKIAQLANTTDRDLKMAERNRAIGAVLLDQNGEVLGVGANNAGSDRTRHAEVNLVQNYFDRTKKPIPKGATIVTTLKSCKMCAGMIWHAAEDPLAIQVVYKENDPGPHASITVFTPNSFERKRACTSPEHLAAEIEKKL
jgi:tRNA(Arg) A34 adenosine deaminase TadA